jgi:hypothetical protein
MGCASEGLVFVNGTEMNKDYEKELDGALPDKWRVIWSKDNLGALGTLNWVLRNYQNEKFYGFVGDDEFVNTPGFDEILIKAAGDWDIAHGDDGFNNGQRAQGYLVIGGKLARAVGYLALPECWHWYGLDSMWESLAQAKACKKIFVPEIQTEHRHPYHGKGIADPCYELGFSRKDIDQQVYFHWLRHVIKSVVARVEKARSAVI